MIEFALNDRVGRILINRPDASNAFTSEMTRQLLETLENASGVADILAIEAAGPDFTVGRDRGEPKSGTPFETFKLISDLNAAFTNFPGLTIAGARGRTFGFAVGFLMRCDLAIVGDDTRFILDEVKHGIAPTFIMEEILQHLPIKRALDLVVSGREWDAKEALEIGLVSRVVPSHELEAAMKQLVADLARRDRRAILTSKQYIRKVAALPADARSAYALTETIKFATGSR
ncbi:MAG: enoyl-CoA hydratase/isomerase family protein [Pseudorhodoplanes sp.]